MGFSISTVIDDIASTVESTLLSARTSVPDLSPAQWVQILYILATALVVAVAVLPKRARTHLLSYGARASKAVTNVGSAVTAQEGSDDGQYRDEPERDAVQNPDREDDCGRVDNRDGQNTRGATDGQDDAPAGATENTRSSDGVRVSQPNEDDWFAKTMAYITSRGQIPHSWFAGFYVVSLAWSLFWLVQYVTDGRVLHYIASRQAAASAPGMRPGQVPLLWTLMLLQGLRRFTESTWIFKPGKKSTMWVVHWLLGIVYYTNMSVTIWIEGSGKNRSPSPLMTSI
jgi:3-oxo-5-alpha-steroid 4-dehydrogenase 3